MNERTFMNAVLALDNLPDELADYANATISKLDARNEKRKNTLSKTQKENEPIKGAIFDTLKTKGAMFASDIGVALGISASKASQLCRQLALADKIAVTPVKVKGQGTRNQYSIKE